MTATYDLIASNVLTSSASSVTFSSIPATYRDLVLVVTGTNATGDQTIRMQFNSDTGANYNDVRINGNGSTASSLATSGGTDIQLGNFGTTIATLIIQIMDYSATDKHKTVLTRADKADTATRATASRWASTSAINTVYLVGSNSYNFQSGSTFYLYGIVS